MGDHRWNFLLESLQSLDKSLRALGQQLVIAKGQPTEVISDLLARYAITTVVASKPTAYNEQQQWKTLKKEHTHQHWQSIETVTLFDEDQLNFPEISLAPSFSKFRRVIENNDKHAQYLKNIHNSLVPRPTHLPAILHVTLDHQHRFAMGKPDSSTQFNTEFTFDGFKGGENEGLKHLERYFSSKAPSHYKETRNALGCDADKWQLSSKFSPWLANGCLSARHIAAAVNQYEVQNGANDSTYWIIFELLWREYFQWYSRQHQQRLFYFKGIQKSAPLTSFYPQRFKQWCSGNTPWPLVNACMNQLNHTGFLSNRGRQIVASCLVNELSLDWRCGAAYFEQQLIDYDPAANWGNWQYIAGVGADPRGGRHFSIEKQQRLYDPEQAFITRWQGNLSPTTQRTGINSGNDDVSIDQVIDNTIDSVDAADWPIESP